MVLNLPNSVRLDLISEIIMPGYQSLIQTPHDILTHCELDRPAIDEIRFSLNKAAGVVPVGLNVISTPSRAENAVSPSGADKMEENIYSRHIPTQSSGEMNMACACCW